MTNQEKEALLKRIYSLPTEWADGGGSYGKGGPVGSEDAAMLWPEDVIDAIIQFAEDNNVPVKQPDPITGLVPCGCGGKAKIWPSESTQFTKVITDYEVGCTECAMTTGWVRGKQEHAVKVWNTAMGWKGGAE